MNRASLPTDMQPFEQSLASATCFPGSEIRLPQSYTKGRRPETSAFSRSIASFGNQLRRVGESLSRSLGRSRDSRRPIWRSCRGPILPKTLGRLGVSRRLGYRLLRPLNRSQPLHDSRVCIRPQAAISRVARKSKRDVIPRERLHVGMRRQLDCLLFASTIPAKHPSRIVRWHPVRRLREVGISRSGTLVTHPVPAIYIGVGRPTLVMPVRRAPRVDWHWAGC